MNDNKLSNVSNYKNNIWSAVIAAILSLMVSSIIVDWNKIGDSVTHEELKTEIESSSEDILERSRRYTDDKVNGLNDYYNNSFQHMEKIINANNEKFELILHSIDNRLDRIDKRIPK
jgi:mannitol-specific phosphotransferase system IIBC component